MKKSELEIGGQAVIEGVLMRTAKGYAISIRKKGKIITKTFNYISLTKKYKFLGLYFIRGIIGMFEMLKLGFQGLNWSAEQQLAKKEKISTLEKIASWVFAIAFGILIFVLVPLFATRAFNVQNKFLFNIIDGVLRMIIFVLYVLIISFMKDVRKLFQYHGAEHKSVFCYEAGKPLTYENVKKYSTKHPRCGTSFVFIVLLISILIFTLVHSKYWYYQIAYRLLLIPIIAGISYEILKLSSKLRNNFIVKLISLPGILLQYITTKEPSKKQIEVAISSLKAAINIK